MNKLNSNNLIIILIIAIAFLARITAFDFGLPNVLSFGDEIAHIAAAFNMLQEKTLRANFNFYYTPPLMSYLLTPIFGLVGFFGILGGVFNNISDFKEFVILHKEYFLIVSRLISAIFGTLSVYFIYLFSKEFFRSSEKAEKIALISALFLVFDFLSVHESQIGRFWSPLAFFIIASAYFILKIYNEGNMKWHILAGVSIGFGFGMGYLTALMLPFFVLAHFANSKIPLTAQVFGTTASATYASTRKISAEIYPCSENLAPKKEFWNLRNKKILLGFGFALFLIVFFIYLNFTAFHRQFGHVIFTVASFFGKNITFTEIDAPQTIKGNFFYLKETLSFLWHNSLFFFIFGLLGFFAVLLSKKEKFLKILFIGFPALYLFVITFLFTGVENRYILPAVPFFIVADSYFIFYAVNLIFKKNSLKNFAIILLVLIFLSYSFYLSASYSLKLRKNDTRQQAVNWVYENVPSKSKIILWDEYTEINENQDSVSFLARNNPKRMDVKRKYLLNLDESKYENPSFFVYPLSRIDTSNFNLYETEADYLFFTFWDKKEQDYLKFFSKKSLVKKFYPKDEFSDIPNLLNDATARPFYNLRRLKFLGPYVEIYKFD